MTNSITRRDFLNGTALVVSGLALANLTGCDKISPSQSDTPAQAPNTQTPPPPAKQLSNYPPEFGGLRGNHEGSFDVAHELAWQKKPFDVSGEPVQETVDLVVVGAGISGLSAAYFYQKKFPTAKILILDNHDDFGGHAKRNEFHTTLDGKDIFRISFGGSESIDTPSEYSEEAINLLTELGVDVQKFYTYFDQNYFKTLNMKDGVFFGQSAFGQSVVIDDMPTAQNAAQFFTKSPLPASDQIALIELYANPQDYLANLSNSQKEAHLKSISYDKFLKDYAGLSDSAMRFMSEICLEYWGVNADALSAYDAFVEGYAGFDGLGLETEDEGEDEPYIFHFPDGNASIARLLVKKMIPSAIANPDNSHGKSEMEAIVLDKFDYAKLDMAGQAVNLRLSATAVQVKNLDDGTVMVGYKKDNNSYRVDARHCILACQHGMVPFLDKELSHTDKDAFLQNIKVPMIYTKILVKDWQAFVKLGVKELYAPKSPYCLVMVDYPVSMGGYTCPQSPSEPMVVHMVRVAVPYRTGKDVRESYRMGRADIYGKSFAELEQQALDQLREIYQVAGETLDDKVLAVTINRWGHGYSYEQNRLFDKEDAAERILATVKKPHGHIYMANGDADWSPYLDGAIDQAWRAVSEIG